MGILGMILYFSRVLEQIQEKNPLHGPHWFFQVLFGKVIPFDKESPAIIIYYSTKVLIHLLEMFLENMVEMEWKRKNNKQDQRVFGGRFSFCLWGFFGYPVFSIHSPYAMGLGSCHRHRGPAGWEDVWPPLGFIGGYGGVWATSINMGIDEVGGWKNKNMEEYDHCDKEGHPILL